jgi:hypothetical protein
VWAFYIRKGYYISTDLGNLSVVCAFNTPSPFPSVKHTPWKCILFIDQKADSQQAEALDMIYRKCWAEMGDVITVKRAAIEFTKELLDGGPAAKYKVMIPERYHLVTRPFRTQDGKPRHINSRSGALIYIGISLINEFKDVDLPRGNWNAPGMSVTYYDFVLKPSKLAWLP